MHPFGNNKPNLSASDIVKKKRSTAMYKSYKSNYRYKNNCGRDANVHFNVFGRIRNVKNYETWQGLKTGNIMCKSNALCCADTSFNTIKINSGNNNHTVLDISAHLIYVRRNDDDDDNIDSVVIDPEDNLFPTNNCIEPPFKIEFKSNKNYECNFKDTRQGYLRFLGDRNYKVKFI
jgi:hypothetical protein